MKHSLFKYLVFVFVAVVGTGAQMPEISMPQEEIGNFILIINIQIGYSMQFT